MRIFVRLSFEELGLETMVGPVVVQRTDTVGVAESKIHVGARGLRLIVQNACGAFSRVCC